MRRLIAVVGIISMLLVITGTALAITVIPDIKANNSDGPVTIQQADNLSVAVSLDPDSSSADCDWWVVADTPFGWYYFDVSVMSWAYAGVSYTDLSPTYQGPLFGLSTFEVLNMPGLSVGTYTFYFAVDTNMNGSLDPGQLYYDIIIVNVTFSSSSTLIPGQGFNTLNFSSNGVLNQILLYDNNLVYRTLDDSSGVIKEESVTSISKSCSGNDCFEEENAPAVLLMSSDDTPHILLAEWGGITHYQKVESRWESESIMSSYSPYHNFVAEIGPDDSLHILMDTFGAAVIYGTNKNGTWEWEQVDTISTDIAEWLMIGSYSRYFSMAVDSNNFAHVVYTSGFTPSNPPIGSVAYSELKYATNKRGPWQSEIIVAPSDGSGDAGYAASVAVDNSDNVVVAAFYVERVATGSAQYSHMLYLQHQSDGSWTQEVVVNTPDGYSAGDVGNFSGFVPYLRFDKNNYPHIVFSDHASHHFPLFGADEFAGQIRYAYNTGSGWIIQTIYSQVDPIINQMAHPIIAISNSTIAFAGMKIQDTVDSSGLIVDRKWEYIELSIANPVP